MGLGREVDDRVTPLHRSRHDLGVADVTTDERVTRVALDVAQVLETPGVGQDVEVHHLETGTAHQQVANEVGSNEAAAPSYQDALHGMDLLSGRPPDGDGNRPGIPRSVRVF